MWRIMTLAAAAVLVALTTTGAPARAEDNCDAVTKRALREFKTTLDRHKERWVELQGTENESDPVIMQLCSFNKLLPPAPGPGGEAKD
jgi:arginine utilization protein RocB